MTSSLGMGYLYHRQVHLSIGMWYDVMDEWEQKGNISNMHNDLFSIWGLTVHSYGLMIALGVAAALAVGMLRARRSGLNSETVLDIALLGVVLGFIGAKILYVIIELPTILRNPVEILSGNGFVVYGGIISGVLAAIVYCRRKKCEFKRYLDLLIPSVALAQGFGRIGCFLAGCCYGCPTTSWWGVTFPAGGIAPAGIPLIPTQLISAGGDFLLAAVLILFSRHAKRSGDVGAAYLVLYGIGRFLIEFLRNDERGSVSLLSTSQFISLFILVGGVVLFWSNFHRGRKEVPSKSSL